MKKILLLLTTLFPLAASAQLNGDGYYRIQNYATQRYIVLNDSVRNGEIDMNSASADVSNLATKLGFENVKSTPASIFYIQKVGTQYNLISQGLSIYELTGGRLYLDIYPQSGGAYYLFEMTSGAVAGHLFDSPNPGNEGNCMTKKSTGSADRMFWKLIPVNTEDNYIGLQPTVEAADGWYGTVYADYPFKLASDNVKVYYVDAISNGEAQLKEITDEVKPAATPLVFKTNSNDPAQNKVIPVYTNTSAPTDNKLKGTYYASSVNEHICRVEYNSASMRVLGVDSNKKLIFTTAKEADLTKSKYIPMNTCWLEVPTSLSGDLKTVVSNTPAGIQDIHTDGSRRKGTYTLTGVRVDNEQHLRAGIYIQNGKKVVIK